MRNNKNKQIVLYLARHGETPMNREDVFRTGDPPLDKGGMKAAGDLARYFKNIELSFIIGSDKKRTKQTGDIIRIENPQIPHAYMKELRPWDVGDFGGKPKDKENIEKLRKYVQNPDLKVPGSEGSLSDFRARIRPLLIEGFTLAQRLGKPGLWVMHSSILHEAGSLFTGSDEGLHVKPGGLAAVYLEDNNLGGEILLKPDPRSQTQNVLGAVKERDTVT